MRQSFEEWMKAYHFPRKRKAKKHKKGGFPTIEERLKPLGYSSYEQYLSSPHWYQFWHSYYSMHPHVCFVTGLPATELHHVSYERLGREQFDDVVPVSHLIHDLIHHCSKKYGVPLNKAHLMLKDVMGAFKHAGLTHDAPIKFKWPK